MGLLDNIFRIPTVEELLLSLEESLTKVLTDDEAEEKAVQLDRCCNNLVSILRTYRLALLEALMLAGMQTTRPGKANGT